MAFVKALAAALAMIAAPAMASQEMTPTSGAPEASPDALYCLHVEPVIGSRIETVQCWTRAEWAEGDVDIDKDWAKEGVAVLDPNTRQPVTS